MTNGDYIRQMSDEELADFIQDDISLNFCRELKECIDALDNGGVDLARCRQCALLWLRSERMVNDESC